MKRTYADGETIFKEGEPSDAAYVVVEMDDRGSRGPEPAGERNRIGHRESGGW